MEKTYTTKEAAEVLRVTPDTIRNMIAQGKLKAVKLGKQYVLLESDLRNCLRMGNQIGLPGKRGNVHEFY